MKSLIIIQKLTVEKYIMHFKIETAFHLVDNRDENHIFVLENTISL